MAITLYLGRDGMGTDDTEAAFDAWVAFVAARIDDACGRTVNVEARERSEQMQDDWIRNMPHDANADEIFEAKQRLWQAWCALDEGETPPAPKEWRVYNRVTGHEFGCYEGFSPESAIAAMHRDAGYIALVDNAGVLRTTAPGDFEELEATAVA